MTWKIAALYRFVAIDDLSALRAELQNLCEGEGVCGTLLIAPEGINGTIAGPPQGLDRTVAALDRALGVRQGELKFSETSQKPFSRLKVRIKAEIITLRAPEADPTRRVGTYVEPKDWNALIDDPNVLVIDTRNTYETMVGSFDGAVDPKIETFTQFKDFVADHLDPACHKRVAMYCTGGIRCEKASSYLLGEGFAEVFHLKGGILRYLENVHAEDSRWRGDCYVFDGRVAVGHGLSEAEWDRCFGCGAPLRQADLAAPAFEEGVSCPHCIDALTTEKAAALRMRQSQIDRRKSAKS